MFYSLVLGLLSFVISSQLGDWLNSEDQILRDPPALAFTPLDSLNSAEIAYGAASLGEYLEITWIENQVQSSRNLTNLSVGNLPIISKPAVVNSTIRTRKDIINYVVSPGDTVIQLAQEFNVSEQGIRLSNGLLGNRLEPGSTIVLPPPGLRGVVYTIAAGDSLRGLGENYDFLVSDFLHFNDIESFDELAIGEQVFLPEANQAQIKQVPEFLTLAAGTTNLDNLECYGCRIVDEGDRIGRMGNTGWSTGPHLHLEILDNFGQHYNPWNFLNQNRLHWPVRQTQRRVTQIYHSGHLGLDVGDREGTDILAIGAGEIIYRGCLWEDSLRWSTFGVIIDHGSYYSLSIHLQAPNNRIYEQCSLNRRTQYGQPSIDYEASI